jgi:uncharacterized protein
VSDNLERLVRKLPVLRTGEAIIIGEAVNLPMRVLVEAPNVDRPDSADPQVFDDRGPGGWNKPREPEDYGELVARQHPRPLALRPGVSN